MSQFLEPLSVFLLQLRDRIDLTNVPFSDRMARIMLFRSGDSLTWRSAPAATSKKDRPPLQ